MALAVYSKRWQPPLYHRGFVHLLASYQHPDIAILDQWSGNVESATDFVQCWQISRLLLRTRGSRQWKQQCAYPVSWKSVLAGPGTRIKLLFRVLHDNYFNILPIFGPASASIFHIDRMHDLLRKKIMYIYLALSFLVLFVCFSSTFR